MKWGLITDSSCDYMPEGNLPDQLLYGRVPFIINVGANQYIDDGSIDLPAMIDDMESCPDASRTACPSPNTWAEYFEQVDQVIAITISSNLSGSYNSAMIAKDMVLESHPDKKIYIVDSRSAGSGLSVFAEKMVEMVEKGASFEEVVEAMKAIEASCHTIFALCSYNNLVKNGRVNKLVGLIAGKLKLWGIGIATPEGTIHVVGKARGLKKILEAFDSDMKKNNFTTGKVFVSQCQNPEVADKFKEYVESQYAGSEVIIYPCFGLTSFYAERKGLIITYTV